MSIEKDGGEEGEASKPASGATVTSLVDHKEKLRLAGGTDQGDARILYGSFENTSQPLVLLMEAYDEEEDKTHLHVEIRLPKLKWYRRVWVVMSAGFIVGFALRMLVNVIFKI